MISHETVALFIPALVLFGAIFILLFGLSSKYTKSRAYYITTGIFFIVFLISLNGLGSTHSTIILPEIFNKMIVYDTFSATFISLFLLGTFLTLAIAKSYIYTNDYFTFESFVLLFFALFGMVILSMANELLTAFIALEIASMSVYVLVGLNKDSYRASEAFFKYLLLGSFAASFYLLGMMLIFAQTKSTNILDIALYVLNTDLNSQLLVVAGGLLIMITILFKIAAVPFGAWVIDVYEGASLPITSFMAAVFKIAVFAFAMRIFLLVYKSYDAIFDPLILGGAVVTMIVGSLLAVVQSSIKKMLAASSVVHSGYILIAFASIQESSIEPSTSIMFYLFAYFISAIGAFGVLSYLNHSEDTPVRYDDLNGLASQHPLIAASLTIFLLSLAGFPSTIGFIGKFYIFTSAIDSSYTIFAVLGALSAFVSIYYYFKVILHMYFKKPIHEKIEYDYKISFAFIVFSAAIVLWGGVGTSLVLNIPGIDALNNLSKYAIESLL